MNVEHEYERNGERYEFLKWGQEAFDNFRVVPPGTGICHQVNLEYLGQTVWTKEEGGENRGLSRHAGRHRQPHHHGQRPGRAGWGVGGIEAEAAMLGQPISMLIPEVVGFKLTGKMAEGTTATDLVLTVVQMLRQKGVVGKFVEFYGPASIQCRCRPRDHRQHGAGIRRDLRLLPDRRETLRLPAPCTGRDEVSRWSKPMPRRKACGATPDAADPGLHRHAGTGPGHRRAVDGRARSVRRTACPDRSATAFAKIMAEETFKKPGPHDGGSRYAVEPRTTISATATS
jgi:hypothetical protein